MKASSSTSVSVVSATFKKLALLTLKKKCADLYERQTDISHLLVPNTDIHKIQRGARLKLGDRCTVQGSYTGGRDSWVIAAASKGLYLSTKLGARALLAI